MTDNKDEIISAFINMMKDLQGITQNDKIYQESINDLGGIVKKTSMEHSINKFISSI